MANWDRMPATELKQFLDHVRGSVSGVLDLLQVTVQGVLLVQLHEGQIGIPLDACEQVVEAVGDACRQCRGGLELSGFELSDCAGQRMLFAGSFPEPFDLGGQIFDSLREFFVRRPGFHVPLFTFKGRFVLPDLTGVYHDFFLRTGKSEETERGGPEGQVSAAALTSRLLFFSPACV